MKNMKEVKGYVMNKNNQIFRWIDPLLFTNIKYNEKDQMYNRYCYVLNVQKSKLLLSDGDITF